MVVDLLDADDGLEQFKPMEGVAVHHQQVFKDHLHAIVSSSVQAFKQREELSFFIIDQQICEDIQCHFLPLRSPCLQNLTDHKIYEMFRLEDDRMLVEDYFIAEMFKDIQNPLSQDSMMHLVLITQQVSMVLQQLIKEGKVMAEQDFQLGFVLRLKADSVGQRLHYRLCDLRCVLAGLPSNDYAYHFLDHLVEQMLAIICEFLVKTGDSVGESEETVGDALDDLIAHVEGQELIDFVHKGGDGFFLFQLQVIDEQVRTDGKHVLVLFSGFSSCQHLLQLFYYIANLGTKSVPCK